MCVQGDSYNVDRLWYQRLYYKISNLYCNLVLRRWQFYSYTLTNIHIYIIIIIFIHSKSVHKINYYYSFKNHCQVAELVSGLGISSVSVRVKTVDYICIIYVHQHYAHICNHRTITYWNEMHWRCMK